MTTELIFEFIDKLDRLYLYVEDGNPMLKQIEETGNYDGYCVWAEDIEMPCRMPEPTTYKEFEYWFEEIFPDLILGFPDEQTRADKELDISGLIENPDGTHIRIDSQSVDVIFPDGTSYGYELRN